MRIAALVRRIIKQMLRDKRTLALLFLAPLFVLTLMYFFFNGNTVQPELGTVNVPESLAMALEERGMIITSYGQATEETVIEEDLDGLLALESGRMTLTLLNDDPSLAKNLLAQVSQTVLLASGQTQPIPLEIAYIYGSSDTEFFDVLSPVLIGFFVFFFVFLISGIGLLKERVSGTLERLMATPIRKGELIAAYLIGFGIFAVIQTVIVVAFSITVLDVVLVGSVWHVLLINLLLALVALSLGILLSTFASSEFQMVQFIPIVVVPQIFFAGIFPVEGLADWLQAIGRIMPIYYAADALKAVMYKGQGFSEISGDLLALVIFASVFIVLNLVVLRRHRKL
ncbi:ABC-2 type transport system permease protein [Planococcus glaciei]|uniref:ABC transporter permease n=1 Tax=Planococcus glaciei TaxID=459472 RepID=UPI0008896F73|nr:ABC transporter permease [Planococcus glaciei]SDH51314.1 ABC-2 type transport system permease protein [Planococcus glaciei]